MKIFLFLFIILSQVCLAEIDSILKKMEHDDFSIRQKASLELNKWAEDNKEKAKGILVNKYKGAKSPEVRYRVYKCLNNFFLNNSNQSYLGVIFKQQEKTKPNMLFINKVLVGSPADLAGIKKGQVILLKKGQDFDSFKKNILETPIGFSVSFTILDSRGENKQIVSIKTGDRKKIKFPFKNLETSFHNWLGMTKRKESVLKIGDYIISSSSHPWFHEGFLERVKSEKRIEEDINPTVPFRDVDYLYKIKINKTKKKVFFNLIMSNHLDQWGYEWGETSYSGWILKDAFGFTLVFSNGEKARFDDVFYFIV